MRFALLAVAVLTAASLSAGAISGSGRAAAVPDDPVHSDFNGDGYEDIAVGAPSERVNGYFAAGAVHVLYGGPNGVTSAASQVFTQATSGISGVPQTRDFFGLSLAAGDFDADGYADLAIGVPREDIGGNTDEGIVEILRGSSDGLEPWAKRSWQGVSGATIRCRCRFGESLAALDFNRDGAADLAIGAPLHHFAIHEHYGQILVIQGVAGSGLMSGGQVLFSGQYLRSAPIPPTETEFGAVLAAGDTNGDGYDDLVASSRMDGLLQPREAHKGAIWLIKGSRDRLGDQQIRFHPFGGESFSKGDGVGAALALGDFDDNGKDEIAVGIPYDDLAGATDAGSIMVLSDTGRTRDNQYFDQGRLAAARPDTDDLFGYALATGDFDGDGVDDLAVGAPFENFSGSTNAGIVHVLYGARNVGLVNASTQIFHQDKPGIAGAAESGDTFAFSLTARRLGKSAAGDLAIGIPGEALGSKDGAGALAVLYGSTTARLSATGSQFWSQDSPGVGDNASSNDSFGQTLP